MRYLTPVLLAAAASVLSTAPAYADLGDQLFKLLPNDGAAADEFGRSVAISGATAIVGAWLDDDNGSFSGSAYLFDISDPANPTQIAKLLPNDGAAEDFFGLSVAISPDSIGTTAIVGARFDDDNGTDSGSAYLFDTTTGTQIAKLLPHDGAANDRFGYSVAISPDSIGTAIVGAIGDDNGSVYLFDTTTGRQLFKLLASDGAPGDGFGWSVAISGATAIVGAIGDDDNGTNSGSAYLFDISHPKNPVQIAKLLPDDGAADDWFGYFVAISGTTAIVGARLDGDNGTWSGSAYLFDATTGRQIAKLLPDDGAEVDYFGHSVAISGTTAIVGAYGDDDNGAWSGSAYLFDAAVPGKCPADLDNSGDVGVKDLLFLLGAWGACPPKGGCPADFDGSNDVGVKDLLFLLGNWGPCP